MCRPEQQSSINPGGPKAGDTPAEPLITRYQYADLTVTVSSGSNSYSTTKRIGKQIQQMIIS